MKNNMSNSSGIYIQKDKININTVINSGQIFSFEKISDNLIRIFSDNKCCVMREDADGYICYIDSGLEDNIYWKNYFNLSSGDVLQEILENETNEFLRKCAEYSKGMVILKQDLWEMIISFIISQRKSIPAIKTSLQKFREKFGEECEDSLGYIYYTFPTAEMLDGITFYDLQGLGLGYRDKYILDAIRWWNENYEKYKEELESDNRERHMEILKQIKGIGDKVANCICLFALNDLDAFPVDVWIQRVLDSRLFTMKEIEKYKDKGMVQQIIFYYVINHKDEFK